MTQEKLDKALVAAAAAGNAQKVRALIGKGAKVDAAGEFGYRPLPRAVRKWHKEVAEVLIAAGANVNAAEPEGWRPLHWAAVEVQKDIVELLLAHGANPLLVTEEDRGKPRDYCNDKDIIALLKKAEREWRKREKRGKPSTPLAALRARLRQLGSLRPKVPSL